MWGSGLVAVYHELYGNDRPKCLMKYCLGRGLQLALG